MSEAEPTVSPLEQAAEALADATLQPARAERGCPAGEEWSNLVAGAVAPANREGLLDHLATCPDCAAEVKALREVQSWADGAAPLLGVAPAATRARISPAFLAAAGVLLLAAAVTLLSLFLLQRQRVEGLRVERAALEASLSTATEERAGLERRVGEVEGRLAASESRVAELLRPKLNVAVVDLAGAGLVRGGGTEAPEVARSAGWVTLLLHPRRPRAGDTYTVELLSPTGEQLWQEAGLEVGPDGVLSLVVGTADLPAGLLRLRLRHGGAAAEELALRLVER